MYDKDSISPYPNIWIIVNSLTFNYIISFIKYLINTDTRLIAICQKCIWVNSKLANIKIATMTNMVSVLRDVNIYILKIWVTSETCP